MGEKSSSRTGMHSGSVYQLMVRNDCTPSVCSARLAAPMPSKKLRCTMDSSCVRLRVRCAGAMYGCCGVWNCCCAFHDGCCWCCHCWAAGTTSGGMGTKVVGGCGGNAGEGQDIVHGCCYHCHCFPLHLPLPLLPLPLPVLSPFVVRHHCCSSQSPRGLFLGDCVRASFTVVRSCVISSVMTVKVSDCRMRIAMSQPQGIDLW